MIKYLLRLKNEKGTETIEFVILFPLMLFLIFGSIVYMLAVYSKMVVVDAAREGARAVAIEETENTQEVAENKVREVITGFGLSGDYLEPITVDSKEENGTLYVSVSVLYKQPSLFPGLPTLIGNSAWGDSFMLRSKAIFKKEKIAGTSE